jgi:hypothetical protein
MNSGDLSLALINVALCWWRAIATMRQGRLIAVIWILIAYFAIFFVPVSLTDDVKFIRGFFAEPEIASHEVIHKVMIFVVIFNLIFAFAEALLWRLVAGTRRPPVDWRLSMPPADWERLRAIFLMYWLVGGVWWFWQTTGAGYRDYVEGASWGSVIFWASSPLIVLSAMSNRWAFASALCLPFLYFCVHLAVRSFVLLSIVPLFVVGFYQVANRTSFNRAIGRLLRYLVVVVGLLYAVSYFVSQYKDYGKGFAFPDSGMPFGVVETVAMVDRFNRHVGFDGLILYGWNYINPFMKLFGIPKPSIPDTPTVIAGLLDGVPANFPVLYHYPALLWADAYISFAWAGLWMAVLWAVVVCIWELLMRRNQLLLSLLLPFFCWHSYMLVRGAVAVASVPVSYSLYFALFPFLLIYRRRLFSNIESGAPSLEPEAISPPPNLMR